MRYVVVLIGAYAIAKLIPIWFEDFRYRVLRAKVTATAHVVAGLVFIRLREGPNGSGQRRSDHGAVQSTSVAVAGHQIRERSITVIP